MLTLNNVFSLMKNIHSYQNNIHIRLVKYYFNLPFMNCFSIKCRKQSFTEAATQKNINYFKCGMLLKINHTKQKLGISDGVFSVT